jgi:hypothetical protein
LSAVRACVLDSLIHPQGSCADCSSPQNGEFLGLFDADGRGTVDATPLVPRTTMFGATIGEGLALREAVIDELFFGSITLGFLES